MIFTRFYQNLTALTLGCLFILLSACEGIKEPSSLITSSQVQTLNVRGGLDGSGGDLIQSSSEEVKNAFEQVIRELGPRLIAMEKLFLKEDEFVYNYRFGELAYSVMSAFFQYSPQTQHKQGLLASALASQKIIIEPQTEECLNSKGAHTGNAQGTTEQGVICISLNKLKTISPIRLHEEIFQLLIHELSHLVGFDENEAVKIQKLISMNTDIYIDGSLPFSLRPRAFTHSFQSCIAENLFQEIRTMETSPYWQKQMKTLVSLLTGAVLRQGDGPDGPAFWSIDRGLLFLMNARFLAATSKFKVPRQFRKHAPGETVEPHVRLQVIDIEGFSSIASADIITPTGAFNNIEALPGKNAQCSIKILIANLIASIPDVLLFFSPEGALANSPDRSKLRILKEKEILDGAIETEK